MTEDILTPAERKRANRYVAIADGTLEEANSKPAHELTQREAELVDQDALRRQGQRWSDEAEKYRNWEEAQDAQRKPMQDRYSALFAEGR